jgi:transcriptional regulator with XRE-family HTH domain
VRSPPARSRPKYESGTNRVGASRLTKIAEALDVAILTLFGSGKGMAERPPDHLPAARLLANPDALRVLQAFDKIDVSRVRLAALHLFEAVGEMPSKRTPRPPPARRRR